MELYLKLIAVGLVFWLIASLWTGYHAYIAPNVEKVVETTWQIGSDDYITQQKG